MSIKLTPTEVAIPGRGRARHRFDDAAGSTSSGGGGGGKWVLLTAAVAAVGVGAYMYITKNGAPVPGTITASSTTALMGATVVQFSVDGASDPDQDPLTYTWDFGDGGTETGETVEHVFAAAGELTVKLSVSDGKKTATTQSTVTVKSMTGIWAGMEGSYDIEFNLAQTGSAVLGSYSNASPLFTGPGTVTSGSVSDPRSVTLKVSVPAGSWGNISYTYAGQLSEDLDTLIVRNGSSTTDITLTRQ